MEHCGNAFRLWPQICFVIFYALQISKVPGRPFKLNCRSSHTMTGKSPYGCIKKIRLYRAFGRMVNKWLTIVHKIQKLRQHQGISCHDIPPGKTRNRGTSSHRLLVNFTRGTRMALKFNKIFDIDPNQRPSRFPRLSNFHR
jgi:hypothetical protein